MRISPVLPAIVVTTIAAVYGCGFPREGLPGGVGGSMSATSVGGERMTTTSASGDTASSTSTGVPACTANSACGITTPCASFACTMGKCVQSNTLDGTPLPDDHLGDCQQPTCKGGVEVMQPSATDFAEDGNPCTVTSCKDGLLVQSPLKNGAACGTEQHCLDGQCRDCATDGDCKDDDNNSCTDPACNGGTCGKKNVVGICINGGPSFCSKGSCCPVDKICDLVLCCGPSQHCAGPSGCKAN